MKPVILRTDTEVHITGDTLNGLRRVADVVTSENNDEETLIRDAEDADLIIVSCFTKITARVIETASKLKGIVKCGVGVDNIDLEAATRRGVLVVNCPEYGAETIADHAFTLMLCLARKIIEIDRETRRSAWIWPSPEYIGVDIFGKTLGIIGLGRIGKAMARRAGGFGMETLVYDPYVTDGLIRQYNGEPVGLDELLRRSDFVSIHCILTPETRGLIGKRELKMMKKTGFILDVSRGAIIDEAAIITALREGWIAGAGFDVFSEEPLSLDHPLFDLDNLILTPHLAWYTQGAFDRLEREAVQRALEILEGKTPKNVVNVEVLDRLG